MKVRKFTEVEVPDDVVEILIREIIGAILDLDDYTISKYMDVEGGVSEVCYNTKELTDLVKGQLL